MPQHHPWDSTTPTPTHTPRAILHVEKCSKEFRGIRQGYRRKKHGSDGETGKWETIKMRRRRDGTINSWKTYMGGS